MAYMNLIPETIDLNPSGNEPKASIIWLHGLGADGNDFVPIVEQLGLENYQARFIFPHAPIRSITINGGMKMRAWYDIFELSSWSREDVKGIQESADIVNRLIEREIQLGVPANKIILGGFSQGGALALYTALRYPIALGGILSLSAYLPAASLLTEERSSENAQTPIFIAHGLSDPVVPLMWGTMCRKQLEGLNYRVEWHSYSMAHTVIQEEIIDVANFCQSVLTF